jgi:hypothetical protein
MSSTETGTACTVAQRPGMNGARLVRIANRLNTLADITGTVPGDWTIDVTAKSAEAVYLPSGCYVTIEGGGDDSPETVLDQRRILPTVERRAMATGHGFGPGWSPGALAVALVKEFRRNEANKARRIAKATA